LPARVLVYGRGVRENDGRYMMSGWKLEIDGATKGAFDPKHGAWIVADKPRFEPYVTDRDGNERTIVVLHAAEMRATLFPPP
jgi:hypothetical protein